MRILLIFIFLFFIILHIDLSKYSLTPKEEVPIKVTIDGEVLKPGVYELPPYSSMEDLLDASGITNDSDLSVINEQTILKDKDKIIIPKVEEKTQKKISVNTGTKEELILLPGIGESTASKIIEYRNTYGYYQELEDIMKVSGIGKSKYEKMKDYISL